MRGCRQGLLRQEAAVYVSQGYRGLFRTQVRHQDCPPLIQLQKRWPPPSGQAACCPFDHPLFLNQLLRDQGNRASLQPRYASQVGARDRLAPPDQVQNDAAIDVACGFARSHLRVGKADHGASYAKTPPDLAPQRQVGGKPTICKNGATLTLTAINLRHELYDR